MIVKMKNACFWSIVALLAIVLCLATAEGEKVVQYKAYESGSRQVDGKYCGDQIRPRFDQLCSARKRRRRSALMDEQEALSFLLSRSRRNAQVSSTGGGTDIVEECCSEGCASEEILEYC